MRFLEIEIVTAPAEPPVTAQEFIDHARLNGLTVDRQPDLIERELQAATRRGEQYCRRSFLTQTLRALFVPSGDSEAAARILILPRGKVQSVASIESAGAVVDPATYTLEWNAVKLASPLAGSATVIYDSGYGADPADVPDGIKEGILEYAMLLYENRSGGRDQKYAAMAAQGIPDGVRDLWRPFQIEISG
jgi:uncharacterized phiE125 gp8 family phage protein